MEINNLRELDESGTLRRGDVVKFYVENDLIEYSVKQNASGPFLNTQFIIPGDEYAGNSVIFTILGLDKQKFCSHQYGYEAVDGGDWPNSKNDDFRALTRVVKELYATIIKTYWKEDDVKTDRFSLMDLD